MADIIKLLPDHVANQIAAGEVVQRPASVVKELLENAIDAGADVVTLIVKDGGKTLIQVVDDGTGMSATDARLSFERHATSKIKKAEDLFNLHTKGFRGEALASIAAIAHVEMQTRPEGEELGTHLRIEGSRVVSQEAAAVPKGTSIAVKNLFFNIPARRNFLKSNQVELRHILDEFHRVALVHSNVAFHFFNNGSDLFNLPATRFRQRIANIFGAKANERLVPVAEETQVLDVSGFVVKPEFAKRGRGEQFFFVNQRFIKSPYLHHAVANAFEGLLKPDTHPGYFLMLTVDPGSVDINIHPTKTEVKFDDEHTLYAILRSAVKHSLGQFSVGPVLDFDRDRNLDTPYGYKDRSAVMPKVTVDAGFNPFTEEIGGRRPTGGIPIKPKPGEWEVLYPVSRAVSGHPVDFENLKFESEVVSGSMFDTSDEVPEVAVTTFQLRRKYVVTTIKSGMVVIDQNRAHQRVLYDRFKKEFASHHAVSQQLLFPIKLEYSLGEMTVLRSLRTDLEAMGFMFGSFDDEGVTLSGIPLMAGEGQVAEVLERLITDFQMELGGDGFSQSDMIAKTLAKALAVKTGTPLEPSSQLALVNDLFACGESQVGPFGKMIYTTISEGEIDKKFQ